MSEIVVMQTNGCEKSMPRLQYGQKYYINHGLNKMWMNYINKTFDAYK